MSQKQHANIQLIDVIKLSAIEGYGIKRFNWLLKKIKMEAIWSVPLKVEQTKMLIMDGHHRFEVAKALGLRIVPVELFTYDEVEVYSLRKNIEVTSKIILKNAEAGIIFPYKTAKHKFPDKTAISNGFPLEDLK